MHTRGRTMTEPAEETKRQKSSTPSKLPEGKGDTTNKVKILVRMRPIIANEVSNKEITIKGDNTIKLVRPDYTNVFMKFDKVLDPGCQQADIFENVEHAIDLFLKGTNYTIFAYGQTGAGKTYTVIGDPSEAPNGQISLAKGNSRGLLPRALDSIFQQLNTPKYLNSDCRVNISFYEVYNEKIYDLLNLRESFKMNGLELRDGKNETNQIIGLTKVSVRTAKEALEYLSLGLKNRATGSTNANIQSSRSHSIFEITLAQDDMTHRAKPVFSKLRIVDLAGSEKFSIPRKISKEERDFRIQELTSINGSLSALGHCITALVDSKRTHIPFRSSKLTRVLMDSLCGSSRICFIVCISPAINAAAETLSTLQFANRAKKVVLDDRHIRKVHSKTKSINIDSKFDDFVKILKSYYQKHGKTGNFFDMLSNGKLNDLENEVSELREQNEYLRQELYDFKRSCSPILEQHSQYLRSSSTTPPKFRNNNSSFTPYYDHAPNFSASPNQFRTRSASPLEKRVRFGDSPSIERTKSENSFAGHAFFENLILQPLEPPYFINPNVSQDKNKPPSLTCSESKLSPANTITSGKSSQSSLQRVQKFLKNQKNSCEEKGPCEQEKPEKLLGKKLKQKEFERKYELFFADHSSSTTSLDSTSKVNSSLHNLSQLSGQGMNTSCSSTKILARQESKDKEALNETKRKTTPKEASSSISESSDSYQFIDDISDSERRKRQPQKLYQIIDSSTEFQRNPSAEILRADSSISSQSSQLFKDMKASLHGPTQSLDKLSTTSDEHSFSKKITESSFLKKSQSPQISTSEQMIKSIDQKIMSVHEMNSQHEELIKKLDRRLEEYQIKNNEATIKYYEPQRLTDRLDTNIPKSQRSEFSGIIDELKNEVTNALYQIREIQDHQKFECGTLKTEDDSSILDSETSSEDESSCYSRESLQNISNCLSNHSKNQRSSVSKSEKSSYSAAEKVKQNVMESARLLLNRNYTELNKALEKREHMNSTHSITSISDSELSRSNSSIDIMKKNLSMLKENLRDAF